MALIEARRSADGAVSWRVRVRIKGQPEATETFKRKTDAQRWAQATEAAIRHLRGQAVPEEIILPVSIVDRTNYSPWDVPLAERPCPRWEDIVI